jgi:TRAP-type C4-dicarboxylate transport system permease large subunit
MDIVGVVVGVETEISVVDLLVAEFSPKPIATAASAAVTHITARRIEVSLPAQIEIGVLDARAGNRGRSVSYFTLRTIVILMEDNKGPL